MTKVHTVRGETLDLFPGFGSSSFDLRSACGLKLPVKLIALEREYITCEKCLKATASSDFLWIEGWHWRPRKEFSRDADGKSRRLAR